MRVSRQPLRLGRCVCLACASGLFRLAGDVAPGGDTACTYASPFTSKAELVNTIASSYCLGGAAAPHRSFVYGTARGWGSRIGMSAVCQRHGGAVPSVQL